MIRFLSPYLASLCIVSLALVATTQMVGRGIPGDALAFSSERDGNSAIYLADTGSGQLVKLTHDADRNQFPTWSPDGRLLVYRSIAESASDDMEIRLVNLETGERRALFSFPVAEFQPLWSPDSRRFAFTSNNEIYLADVDTGSPRNLSNDPSVDREPMWSPDGRWVAFTSRRDRDDEIYLADVELGTLRNLTQHPGDDNYPIWSPDGGQIAFTSFRDGNGELYILDILTGQMRNITLHLADDMLNFWTPQDDLRFISRRDNVFALYTIDAQGAQTREITPVAALTTPPIWSPDGQYALIRLEQPTPNQEIFLVDGNGGEPRNLTNHPADDFDAVWASDSRQIAFTSARDGNAEIYVLDIRTLALRNLTQNLANDSSPAWRP